MSFKPRFVSCLQIMIQTLGKLGKKTPKNFPKFTCRIFLEKKTHTPGMFNVPWMFLYALAWKRHRENMTLWHLRKQFMLEKLVAFAAVDDFTLWRCAAFVTWKYRLEIEMNLSVECFPDKKRGSQQNTGPLRLLVSFQSQYSSVKGEMNSSWKTPSELEAQDRGKSLLL